MPPARRFIVLLAFFVAGAAWLVSSRYGSSVAVAPLPPSGTATLRPGSTEAEGAFLDVAERPSPARMPVEVAAIDSAPAAHPGPEPTPPPTTRVRVLDGRGHAVVGARAELRADVPEARIRRSVQQLEANAPTPVGTTDDDGALEFPLERRAVCWVEAQDGRLGALQVHPGESTTLTLDGPPRCATFLDAGTRAPVVGRTFPVGVRRGARSATVLLTTDERGRMALPCGPCELQVGMSAPRLPVAAVELADGEGAATDAGFVVMDFYTVGTLAADDRELVILVRNDEHRMRLLDATSGAPIEGSAWLQHIFPEDATGAWIGPGADTLHPVRQGELVVGSWFAAPLEPASRNMRWLAVAGYEVARFAADVDLRSAEVRLSRGLSLAVSVVDSEGRALGGRFSLVTASGPSYRVNLAAGALAGPFPWTQGDTWDVTLVGLGEARRVTTAELGEAARDGGGVVTVAFVAEVGALVVDGVPVGAPPLFALTATGEFREVPVRDGRGALAALPTGAYGVGTRAWLAASGRRRTFNDHFGQTPPPDWHAIQAGEELRVAWNDDWWERTEVRCEVTCDEVLAHELLVLPLTGSLETEISIGPLTPWLPVDSRGGFTLPAGGARPTGLAFARFFAGARGAEPAILDVQRRAATGRYVLRTTSFELHAAGVTGGPGRVAFVHCVTDPAELSASAELVGPSAVAWDTGAPLVMRGLPRNVHALRVLERGARDQIEVSVQPGAFSRVEVALPPATSEAPADGAGDSTLFR